MSFLWRRQSCFMPSRNLVALGVFNATLGVYAYILVCTLYSRFACVEILSLFFFLVLVLLRKH